MGFSLSGMINRRLAMDHPDRVARARRTVLANETGSYATLRLVLAAGVTELIRPTPPIAHPTLVMTCEHDSGSSPAMTRAIAGDIAGAETIIVPGLRHLGLVERPAAFSAPAVDFLGRNAS